jgi:putative transposase
MRAKTAISERRACGLLGISRSVLHYQSKRPEDGVKARLIELAGVRRRFGYRRLQLLLEREGHRVNHKRIYRLYRSAGLAVRRRKRRAHIAVERQPLVLPLQANQTWSMDFVFDALSNGRKLKTLTIVDDCTKECVEIGVDTRINGEAVTRILDCAIRFRGKPKAIRTDQGPEFTGMALNKWAHANGIELLLIQPGKPTQNAYIESFNGKFRDECLNEQYFTSMAHARAVIASWRRDYNEQRPHTALGGRTPAEFAKALRSRELREKPTKSDKLTTTDTTK